MEVLVSDTEGRGQRLGFAAQPRPVSYTPVEGALSGVGAPEDGAESRRAGSHPEPLTLTTSPCHSGVPLRFLSFNVG